MTAMGWRYGGRIYRQWLDARWAAFFDSLGLAYSYEAGGFELGCGRWIAPGFWLPETKRQVEVREWPGQRVPADFWPEHPAWAGDEVAPDGRAGRLVVIYGPPGYRARPQAAEHRGYRIASAWDPADGFLYSAYICGDSQYLWTECPACGKVGIEYEGRADRLCGCFGDDDRVLNDLSPRLVQAYAVASAAHVAPHRLWHGLLRAGPDRGLLRG